jgi:hypothetical protein
MSESSVRWNPTDENYPPKSEEGLLALKKQQEEEEVGFDPLRAAGLAAGASLLRNSGWRRTPMTLGEQIGHAIPAGMEAYYNQDALNQNEQQALYDRQQAEQAALDAKQLAEEKADAEKERATEFRAMLIESGLSRELKRFYMEMYADDPSKTFVALEKKLTEKKASEEKFRVLDPEDPADAKLLKGFKKDRLWQINTKNNKITEVTGSVETADEKKAGRLTMDEAMLAGHPEATAIPPMGGLRLNTDGTRTVVDKYGQPYKGPVEINQYAGYIKHVRENDKGDKVAVWTHTDPAKPDIPVKGIIESKKEDKVDPHEGYTRQVRVLEDGVTEEVYYEHVDPEKPDLTTKNFRKRLVIDPEVAALATGDLSLGNPDSEGYKDAETHLSKAGFPSAEELKEGGITSVRVMRDANQNVTIEFKDEDGHTLTESAAHKLRKRGVVTAEETLKLNKTKFETSTKHWDTEHRESMWQRIKDNKWKKERIEREVASHDIKLQQQQKNLDSGTDYLSRQEFIAKYGDTLPEDVAQVEINKDGTITKMLKEDWTERNVPLNELDRNVLNEELNTLYTTYPEVFTAEKKDGIKILMMGDDPMLALKEAHNVLTKEEVLVQPPAMILKMFNVDLGVMESAQAALNLIEKEEEVQKKTGMVLGLITDKLKPAVVQAFSALKTEAGLIKRNEMIGSQMTDGEIKFSTPFFPDTTDTVSSAKVKLQILLRVSRKRSERIRNMFSKKAGYNDKVWVMPSHANVSVDKEGKVTEIPVLTSTSIED